MKASTSLLALFHSCGIGRSQRLALTCLAAAACLGIGGANAAPVAPSDPAPNGGDGGGNEKEGVFNEFAGRYNGNCVISAGPISAFGRGDAFVRGGKTGGVLTLRATVSANGQTIKSKRIITFKKSKINSRGTLISAGMVQPGTGRGRNTTKNNYFRYRDFYTVSSNGIPQSVLISGNARFFRNSARFIEIWSVSGQTLVFTYRVRP